MHLFSCLINENVYVGVVLYCATIVGTAINLIYAVFNPKIITQYLFVIYGVLPDLCGPVRSVGIATGYGLDDEGIESRWGRDFPNLSRPALGPT
jgi:hypothetical protein